MSSYFSDESEPAESKQSLFQLDISISVRIFLLREFSLHSELLEGKSQIGRSWIFKEGSQLRKKIIQFNAKHKSN